jgi:hypothetical protein
MQLGSATEVDGKYCWLRKTSRLRLDHVLDPNRDITLSSLQRAAVLVGRRVAIALV